MRGRGRVLRAVASAVVFAVPGSLSAQSLLSSGGLGVPVSTADAKAQALGGIGLGLMGLSLTPTDPASAASLAIPSITFTLASSWVDVREGESPGSAQGTRFPVIGVSYPVKAWGVATLTYGGVLDQRWQTVREGVVALEASTAKVTDTFLSEGGLAALRLGFARRIDERLSVGASAGTYTGKLTRRVTREFDSLDVGGLLPELQLGGLWRYSGLTATVGAQFDVEQFLRLSGSVDLSTQLDAEPSDETDGSPAHFDIPMVVRFGASGVLAPGFIASVGVSYADWTSSGEQLMLGSAGSALALGGGIELSRVRLLGGERETPIRLGYRRSELPFTFEGAGPVETAFTAGLGIVLARRQDVTLAAMDMALERGSREAATLSESFSRFSLTLRVSGF